MSGVRLGIRPAVAVLGCCSLLYFLGLWQTTFIGDQSPVSDPIPYPETNISSQTSSSAGRPVTEANLDFNPHYQSERRSDPFSIAGENENELGVFEFCDMRYSEHAPCEDPKRALRYSTKMMFFRERHCPGRKERLRCLIPQPLGYRAPFPWPKSRDYAWYANVPHKMLTVAKADQNWIKFIKDRFYFPGGGTSFPKGARKYIESMAKLVPLSNGSIRTALDTGCGVASWGAYLLDYRVLALSIAPIDVHEAQVQFALERGVPAMVGVLGTRRLPYPSRAFDMAHCSRCLIPWTENGGLYLIEIDRVLRPGGYWVLSGPPINWKKHQRGWNRTVNSLREEQKSIEEFARRLCWKKIAEKDDIAVWKKATNHINCVKNRRTFKFPSICPQGKEDVAWYKNMEGCITPLPMVKDIKDTAGMDIEAWPKRLFRIPPRIRGHTIRGVTTKSFISDSKVWPKRVSYYKKFIDGLGKAKFRNIMDMNAGLGGFAAALSDDPVWVMNVVPEHLEENTLGAIYERGLIGTYMDWCEAFSSYPRTYDLLHAHNIFSMYQSRCDIVDILLEMHRLVRPTGAVIICDHVDVLVKVKKVTDRMRWEGELAHNEIGHSSEEKILFFNNTRPSSVSDSRL